MKQFVTRIFDLVFGVFLFGIGLVLMLKANIGYAPWEVLHVGLALKTGLSIGTMSVLLGIVIVAIVTACGEKVGLGTLVNMVLIGVFIDVLVSIIPLAKNAAFSAIMMVTGLFIISVGSYFYIKSAFGAGPRDNLMIVLNRKTHIPVGVCRSAVELTATLVGWCLGGMIGVGTIVSVIGIGFCIQTTFTFLKFDVSAVKHETLKETYENFISLRSG